MECDGGAQMKYYKNGNALIRTIGTLDLPEITAEQYEAEMTAVSERIEVQTAIAEAHKPFSASEVLAMLIPQQITTLTVDDHTALRMLDFSPEWAADTAYTVGYKVKRNGKLWRVLQAHTAQVGWEPENAASLWEQINETHAGTIDDPIPYSGNMALNSGLYYVQDWVIYKCTRDTGTPVYHALSELVGLYVEKA